MFASVQKADKKQRFSWISQMDLYLKHKIKEKEISFFRKIMCYNTNVGQIGIPPQNKKNFFTSCIWSDLFTWCNHTVLVITAWIKWFGKSASTDKYSNSSHCPFHVESLFFVQENGECSEAMINCLFPKMEK